MDTRMRWRLMVAAALMATALLAYLAGPYWRSPARRGSTAPVQDAVHGPGKLANRSSNSAAAGRPGGDAGRCGTAIEAAFNAHATTLGQRQDARSQLAYAMAVPFEPGFDYERMGAKAVQDAIAYRQAEAERASLNAAMLEPQSPDALFLAASMCGGGESCRGVQKALLAAEPDNLAVWLLEMGWARARNDVEGIRTAFERAAKSRRYDLRADWSMQVLIEAYGQVPLPAVCSRDRVRAEVRRQTGLKRDLSVLDQALMLAVLGRTFPSYGILRQQCAPSRVEAMSSERLADCRTILDRVANGDTLLEQSIALSTMVQLTAEQPDAMVWRERYRELRWIQSPESHNAYSILDFEDYALDEVRAMRGALESAGRWPPPADWLPGDQHGRSLVLTGRPPPPSTH